jgi:aspartyl-tRNA(Asn)/glutamyl-tRNA(Gln) amidotransferase subunit C
MKITRELLHYLCHLSRLLLDEEEEEMYLQQLNRILSYMEKLNSLDTELVEPMSHPFPFPCPLREDEVRASMSVPEALMNAKETVSTLIKVPPVIEVEK